MAATGEDVIVEIGGGEDDFLALEQGSLRRQFVRRVFNTVASNFLLLFTCLLLLNVVANFQITKSHSERSIAFAPVPLLKIGAYTVATYAFLVIAAKYAPVSLALFVASLSHVAIFFHIYCSLIKLVVEYSVPSSSSWSCGLSCT